MDLTSIGLRHGTDKASWHRYTEFYEKFLPARDESITLLEIGVYRGASIRMWSEYFPRARIVGMDFDEGCRQYAGGRVEIVIGDQENRDHLRRLVSLSGAPDVIVDDGGHSMQGQQTSLGFLFSYLRQGGLYIVEDLQTSYDPGYGAVSFESSTLGILEKLKSRERLGGNPFMFEEEVETLQRNAREVEIFHRTELPLRCWKCDSPIPEDSGGRCRCGVELRSDRDSIAAVIRT